MIQVADRTRTGVQWYLILVAHPHGFGGLTSYRFSVQLPHEKV